MTIDNCMRRVFSDARTMVGQHAPVVAARAVLGVRFNKAFKFAFVRNPWDRFVSWYALMVRARVAIELRCETGKADTIAALSIDPASKHWIGFDAFLENWCAMAVQIDGVQRRQLSQWAQLVDANGLMLVDEIGRFENYTTDATRLLANAHIEVGSLPKINASMHRHYSVYYSAFARELIEHAFPEDIVHFGYQFESESDAASS